MSVSLFCFIYLFLFIFLYVITFRTQVSNVNYNFSFILNKNDIEYDTQNNDKISESIKVSLSKSLEINLTDIIHFELELIDRSLNINGKILTTTNNIPILKKNFDQLISKRILSNTIKDELELDDPPRISRFFHKKLQQTSAGDRPPGYLKQGYIISLLYILQ